MTAEPLWSSYIPDVTVRLAGMALAARRISVTNFSPVNDDHAITNVLFSLALDEFIEPAVLAAASAAAPWRDTLPGLSRLPDAQISMLGQTFETPALQAAIVRPDGRPLWALRFNGTELTVECTAYTRWNAVWSQASGYLHQAWDLIRGAQPNAQILEYRLAVTDAFSTDADAYSPAALFVENCPILPPSLYGAGPIWHANTGWVDVVSSGRVFETIQAQSTGQREGYQAKGPYRVTIQHALRASVDQSPHSDLGQMDATITDLHARNKRLLMSALRAEVLSGIGLK